MKKLNWLWLALLPSIALAMPQEERVPGGIALVPLTGIHSQQPPAVFYQGNRVMVLPSHTSDSDWAAMVGIPLNAKPAKEQTLKVGGRQIGFTIKDKRYKSQHLRIKNKHLVNPSADEIKRWRRESDEEKAAFKHWTQPANPVTDLKKPAQGPYSSPFGLRRFYNGEPRAPHSGVDIAAPDKSPILTPASGEVVAVGNYFFNGNTVIIDHGYGLVTMYCHMSRIDVKVGEHLKQGERIGLVGATGRATGPHVHWSVSLNNVRVDPMLFLGQQ